MFQNLKSRLDPKGLLTAASSAETTHEKRANPPASPSRKKPANAQNLENATKDVVLQEYYAVQNQLARYQQRLSDVVQAYKTLQKEKQTLENSLHALSSTVPSDTASQSSESNQVENGEEGDSGDVQSLQQRLSTLAAALSTVTKEKAVLQASYLDDKKRMQQQHKEALQELKNDRDRCVEELAAAKGSRQAEEDLAAARNEVDVLRARLDLAADHADLVASLRQALDEERQRANRLDRELVTVEGGVQQRVQDRAAECARLQAELEDMTELFGELEARRSVAEQRVDSLTADLAQARDDMEALRMANRDLDRQLRHTQPPDPEPLIAPVLPPPPPEEVPTVVDERLVQERVEAIVGDTVRVYEQRLAAVEREHAQGLGELEGEVKALQAALGAAERAHQAQMAALHDQVAANRDRALAMLEEKENELQALKHLLASGAVRNDSPQPEAPTTTDNAHEPLLLQVQMGLARDRELSMALRARAALKEQLDDANMRLEAYEKRVGELQDDLHTLRRAEKRESVSIEYLKAVFLRYFDAPPGQEEHLVRAIAALLQFSDQETAKVLRPFKARPKRGLW